MNRQGIYINGKQVFDTKGKDINSIQIINGAVQTVVGINQGSISMAAGNNLLIVDGQTIALAHSPIINIEVFGNVANLNSGSGNVQVTGNASYVETVNGNVTVDGDIASNVKTVNGDIHCKSILGKIDTVNGDIYR